MSDPVAKAIEVTRIGLLFSAPDKGAKLAKLTLKQADVCGSKIEMVAGEMVYGREYVKSLTAAELKEMLLEMV
jgi:hypothetical protein